MPKSVATPATIKIHRAVGVYLLLAVGLIVGTIAAIAYLFTGK